MNRESHITEVKLENVEQLHNQQLVNKNYQHFSLSSSKKATKEFNLTENKINISVSRMPSVYNLDFLYTGTRRR